MNAQEAIERMEKRLDKLKEKITLFEGQSYRLEHKRLIDEVKAFSIVLESAKLLHADEIDPATNAGGGIVVERFVQKEDYERLGIEVTDS